MKPMNESHLAILRRHMVEMIAIHADLASDEIGRAVLDERVMAAMRQVPRHRFVPAALAPYAYQDTPLPIGFDKTISQPFIVALMSDLLSPQSNETVLEVGTRSNLRGLRLGSMLSLAIHCSSPVPLNRALMKRLVSHRPQAIDLWLTATAASAAIAVITLCAQLP